MSDLTGEDEAAEAEAVEEAEPTVAITVDGVEVAARPGELVIAACERTGTYIPRFCWHPRMRSVGMCRVCLVEIDTGRGPALAPSCMATVAEGMTVSTASPAAKAAQDGVLELLLINHPLDCPVCDKGGECPLQDQTMAYGPGETRFVEEKRHFEKPIPINDVVYLDRERCILCDRCTRFAKEVAGDPLIHFQGRGAHSEVNTFPDHPFASYFSGNTVQICPVGALTAKPYRFKARPWDLREVESTYPNPMGDRVVVQTSRNRVLRFLGVDGDGPNWGWLADRDRFSFEAIHHDDRLTTPLVDGEEASWGVALERAAAALASADPQRIAVLGGARLTNEDQFAWARLARDVLGTPHTDAQLGDGLPADVVAALPRATVDEACTPGGTIVLLGPDPKEQFGTLYLRLRHAVVEDGATLIELTPRATGLSHLAKHSQRVLPGELAAAVRGLDLPDGPVTVVAGRPSLAERADAVVEALLAFTDARFLPLLHRGNVFGALANGLSPGDGGHDAEAMMRADLDVLVLLGADPLADFPDRELAAEALASADTIIALDLFPTPSVGQAHVVFPAAGFAECTGTHTNLEGRVSSLAQAVTPPGTARSDWMIAAELAARLDHDLGFTSVESIQAAMADRSPSAPPAPAPLAPSAPPSVDAYALRLVIDRRMYDLGTNTQHAPSLADMALPAVLALSPYDHDRLVGADHGRATVVSNRGEVTLDTVVDEGVPKGAAVITSHLRDADPRALVDASLPFTEVRVQTA